LFPRRLFLRSIVKFVWRVIIIKFSGSRCAPKLGHFWGTQGKIFANGLLLAQAVQIFAANHLPFLLYRALLKRSNFAGLIGA
jgi:hypothetical protein